MAKGNLLLGMARGSVGDVTFYRANGEQLSRARNRNPKNPNTDPQKAQRIIMKVTVKAYSIMKKICDHSFQGKSYGAECMNYFNSINARLLRDLALQGDGDFVADTSARLAKNPWKVSEGSLLGVAIGEYTKSDTMVPIGNGAPNSLSYADVIDFLGLQRGDQITVMQNSELNPMQGFRGYSFGRFILEPKSGDLSALVTDGTEANDKNLNSVVFTIDDNQLYINVGKSNDPVYGMAVIISRKDGDNWLRSTSEMVLPTDIEDLWLSLEDAMAEEATQSIGDSPYYLNQAGISTQEGGNENP